MTQQRKDGGKPKIATLVPLGAMEGYCEAAEYGANSKYWRDSYREDGGYSLAQALNAAVRHIMKRASGERFDPEMSEYHGRPIDHLAGAIWNIGTALECIRLYGNENVDDLWHGPGSATRAMFEAAGSVSGWTPFDQRQHPEKYAAPAALPPPSDTQETFRQKYEEIKEKDAEERSNRGLPKIGLGR